MTGPLTAAFAQGDGKIIAYVEELPGTSAVNGHPTFPAEGATIEDVRAALIVELALTLAANQHETRQGFTGARVGHRELLTVRGRP